MRSLVFILDASQISFTITPKNLQKIPESKNDIFSELDHQQYKVQSNVRKETFESFLLYWADDTEPDITIDNILEYYQLSDEFGIIDDYISQPKFESIFNLSSLNSFNQEIPVDKTIIEKAISKKLDHYLDEYADYLFKIPVVSLYNIFNYNERKLINQEKAYYSIINAAEKHNPELFILLKTIDGEKLSYQALKDSFNNNENHFKFSPKNTEKYITIIEEKLKSYEEKNNHEKINDLKNFETKLDQSFFIL